MRAPRPIWRWSWRVGVCLLVGLVLQTAVAWWAALARYDPSLAWPNALFEEVTLESARPVILDRWRYCLRYSSRMTVAVVALPADSQQTVSPDAVEFDALPPWAEPLAQDLLHAPVEERQFIATVIAFGAPFKSLTMGGVTAAGRPRHHVVDGIDMGRWFKTVKGQWIALLSDRAHVPTRAMWPGLLGNTLVYGLVPALPLIAWPLTREAWRRRAGRCPACGYDLRGAASRPCPECGASEQAAPARTQAS